MIKTSKGYGFPGTIHRHPDAIDGASEGWIDAITRASQNKIEDDSFVLGCTSLGIVGAETTKFAIGVPDANAGRSGGTR
ncbi:MAG: hypothetical protein WA891_07735 [Acidobacteriaceae bacterium]